jgi:hypothetical protein
MSSELSAFSRSSSLSMSASLVVSFLDVDEIVRTMFNGIWLREGCRDSGAPILESDIL